MKQYEAVPAILRRVITFALVCFAFLFFRAPHIEDAITMIVNGFDFSQPSSLKFGFFKRGEYDITKFTIVISFVLVAFLLLSNTIQYKVKHLGEKFFAQPVYVRWAVYYGFTIAIFELGVFGKNQFIYFQF